MLHSFLTATTLGIIKYQRRIWSRYYGDLRTPGLGAMVIGGVASVATVVMVSSLPKTAIAQTAYPAEVVQEFSRGCETSGQSPQFCSCAINRIQSRYSLAEFAQLSRTTLQVGTPPGELIQVIMPCLSIPAPPPPAANVPSQATQLNAQLQEAVNAKNWNRAIQLVDQMIPVFPERSAELSDYRLRLEALRDRSR